MTQSIIKISNDVSEQLNNFCYIPFHGFTIDPNGYLTYCCMDTATQNLSHKKRLYECVHIDDVEDLQEWWEKAYEPVWETYLENKQDCINPCWRCFKSDYRKGKRPVKESYFRNLKKKKIKWEFDFSSPKVRFLEYSVSNICNQMCVMCSGRNSSQWIDFDEQFGRRKQKITRISNDAIDKIKKIIPDLSVIFLKGGEPFADVKNMEILEYVAEVNPDCTIYTTSNIQTISKKNFNIIKKLKNLKINASIDGIDKIYDWIRGGNFKKMIENAERLYYESGHKIEPATTISIYNFFNLKEILDYFYDKPYVQWSQCYNAVEWPNWSSIKCLPKKAFDETMLNYKDIFRQYNRVGFGNLFEYENNYSDELFNDAKKYTETMNYIRGFDITDYVPELKKLFNH